MALKLTDDLPVLYDPAAGHVTDVIQPDGLTTVYSKKSVADTMAEDPQLVRMSLAQATGLCEDFARKRYCAGQAKQVTKERYWDMLEVLPPCRWERRHTAGRTLEMFHVSERISSDLVDWFIADHTHTDTTYWTVVECASSTREHLAECVSAVR